MVDALAPGGRILFATDFLDYHVQTRVLFAYHRELILDDGVACTVDACDDELDEDGLRRDRQMSETRETVERLKQELLEVRAANVLPNAVSKSTNERSKTDLSSSARSRGRDTRIGAIAGQGRLSLDIDGLKIDSTHDAALASAVQTTKSILKEHG